MNAIGQADLDFAIFLSTRSVRRVNRERFVAPRAEMRIRRYDNETEKQRVLIRNQDDLKARQQ